MEVPEQSNVSFDSEARSSISSNNTNNSQNSTDYIAPSLRQHPRQQPQLLLVKNKYPIQGSNFIVLKHTEYVNWLLFFQTSTALDDFSGDDGIVPYTPTLFTPRRLDGETVSSPHVPSSSQVERFTFVGETQASQISGNLKINNYI